MSKVTLTDLASFESGMVTAINANNTLIEEAFDNTLSRDGDLPNQMNTNLDMNSYRITNVAAPQSGTDAARFIDISDTLNISAAPSPTGQTNKVLTSNGTIAVWVDVYPRTAAEISAGITPTDTRYPELNVKRYGAVGSGAVNDSTPFQNAIAVAVFLGPSNLGSIIDVPTGDYYINVTIGSGVVFRGRGNSTRILPFGGSAVFSLTGGASVSRIGWEDMFIDGNPAFTGQDGILLNTGGAFNIDTVHLKRVRIANCGRYGLRIEGNSFTQQLRIDHCRILDNARAGLSVSGSLLETVITATLIVKNGGAVGAYNNCEFLNSSGGVNRMSWIGGGVNAITSMSMAVAQTALKLEHSQQVTLQMDLETADPMLLVTGNLTQNLDIRGCNFGSSIAGAKMIQIDDGAGIVIDNNNFAANATYTDGILISTAINRVAKLNITDTNRFSTMITTPVNVLDNLEILAGVGYAYRDKIRFDTEGGAGTDDLTAVYDYVGGTSVVNLIDGQKLRITSVNSGRDVTVKHNTGNFLLTGSVDMVLATNEEHLNVEWNRRIGKWIEVSRRKV
jgi:hypothetical protein